MAIFEKSQQAKIYVDPTYPMKASIENTQIVQGHTEYIIKVQNGWINHSTVWYLNKRYNDFVRLNKEFKSQNVKLNLPPKKYIGNLNQKFIVERQAALQNYLDAILSHHSLSISAPIRKFLDIPNSVDSIKHFEDSALQHVSMVLRSENQFCLGAVLPSLGWRPNKLYYKVSRVSVVESGGTPPPPGDKYVLSWTQFGADRIVPDKHMGCVVTMLTSLQHPCIAPIHLFHSTDLGCVKVQSRAAKGSLRDILRAANQQHQSAETRDACAVRSRESIVNISLQTLRALEFLHNKGLCHGHLHTGNILVTPSGHIQLSDIDNYPLGLSSAYRPWLIQHRAVCSSLETIDVFCFGLVLWELCKRGSTDDDTGRGDHHTSSTSPSSGDAFCDILPSTLPDYLDVELRALLSSILSPQALQSRLPSLQCLLSLPLFQGYVLPDQNNNHSRKLPCVKLTSNMKKYLNPMREKTLARLALDHKQFRHEKRVHRMQSLIRADSDVSQYVIERTPSMRSATSDPVPRTSNLCDVNASEPNLVSHYPIPSPFSQSEPVPVNPSTPLSGSEHTPSSSSSDPIPQPNRGALLSSIQSFQKSSLRKHQRSGAS